MAVDMEEYFIEIGFILMLAVVVTGVLKSINQPLIIGYIITGVVAGPVMLNMIQSSELLEIFSRFGIIFLLFIAGCSLDPKVFKKVGRVSLATGIGQVIFTSIIGFGVSRALGFSDIESAYIGIALTFSSTIIIVKLLSEKGDLQTLYGKISLGFLIVQDVFAIAILLFISSFSGDSGIFNISLAAFVSGLPALALLALFSKYVLPTVLDYASKTKEYMSLFAIGWLLAFATVFYSLQLSMEIGALLAGISIAASPHNYQIRLKMGSLSDFFIIFFFVLLGSQMIIAISWAVLLPIIVFSILILIGNPLVVMVLMGRMRYTKRNSFMAGLTVAQISEFSLIVVAMGVAEGHVSQEILSLVTAVGLITIFGSTYMILYANKIYSPLAKYLAVFERKGIKADEGTDVPPADYEIVLFGCGKLGSNFKNVLGEMSKKYLIVDHDPDIVTHMRDEGYKIIHGDANDAELLDGLRPSRIKMIISALNDSETSLFLLRYMKKANPQMLTILRSDVEEDAKKLYDNGATYVIKPHILGGNYASLIVKDYGFDLSKYLRERNIDAIYKQKNSHIKHPK
ncbi:MAG: cation:proton antiporter [Candidatus Thermoplasmatota archaeon]|nr:cation:proton antiporter [Candidatus Thermoplasmatota archaeon]